MPEEWATADSVSNYAPTSISQPFFPGGTVLSVHQNGEIALVAGSQGAGGVVSLSDNSLLHPLSLGKGAATGGLWAHDRAVVATSTGAVKVFEKDQEVASFTIHAGKANAVALHPSGSILASVGDDKSYALYDLESGKVITQVQSNSGMFVHVSNEFDYLLYPGLKCAEFHPDGHLLAAGGADGQIKIFEVKSGAEAATFDLGAPVKCICFSENGIWLAGVKSDSSSISIWDLRKATEIAAIDTGSVIESINWDYTGQFLAAAGQQGVSVQYYAKASKEWSELVKKATPATRIAWGKNAQSLFTVNEEGEITTLTSS